MCARQARGHEVDRRVGVHLQRRIYDADLNEGSGLSPPTSGTRIAELKNSAREDLVHEVFMFSTKARHQSQLIRQSIQDRTPYDFDFGSMSEDDLATYLAENAVHKGPRENL